MDGIRMHLTFRVAADEEITVPTVKYRAFRLHAEEPWPISVEIDRWFAPGGGEVKEVITTRGRGGDSNAGTDHNARAGG